MDIIQNKNIFYTRMAPHYLVDHSAANQIFTAHFSGLGKTHKTNFEEHLHYLLYTLRHKYRKL